MTRRGVASLSARSNIIVKKHTPILLVYSDWAAGQSLYTCRLHSITGDACHVMHVKLTLLTVQSLLQSCVRWQERWASIEHRIACSLMPAPAGRAVEGLHRKSLNWLQASRNGSAWIASLDSAGTMLGQLRQRSLRTRGNCMMCSSCAAACFGRCATKASECGGLTLRCETSNSSQSQRVG